MLFRSTQVVSYVLVVVAKRIGDGTFGICKSCGRQISRQRLEARPVTELCIDCKTRQEKREKEQGR